RVKVAFPIFMEIFIMEFIIEIIREAGVKLPRPVGQAVSIVGGIVIGQAAVNANLVSPVTLVIVALTAISSFTSPVYYLGITHRILRFFLLVCSSLLGTYGFILGLLFIHAHVARLVSFGVPYLSPFSPLRLRDWTDMLIRIPMKKLRTRPAFLKTRKPKKGEDTPMVQRDRRNT
ncbi:spore germination protein, partial [Brevibacillus sp. NL20B1]